MHVRTSFAEMNLEIASEKIWVFLEPTVTSQRTELWKKGTFLTSPKHLLTFPMTFLWPSNASLGSLESTPPKAEVLFLPPRCPKSPSLQDFFQEVAAYEAQVVGNWRNYGKEPQVLKGKKNWNQQGFGFLDFWKPIEGGIVSIKFQIEFNTGPICSHSIFGEPMGSRKIIPTDCANMPYIQSICQIWERNMKQQQDSQQRLFKEE